MNSSSLLMFSFFIVVACIAGAMITYHRHRLNKTRFEHQEPTIGSDIKSSSEPDYNSEINEDVDFLNPSTDDPKRSHPTLKTPTARTKPSQPTTQKSAMVLDSLRAEDKIGVNQHQAKSQNHSELSALFPQDLIILTLLANKERPYVGYELLQALLASGLRFGKMQIFHRYQQLNGTGPIIFSMASIVQPGTFELSKMGGFACPGLTMFLRVSQQQNLSESFDLMLDTARQLTDDLGGDVCDENREILSNGKIADIRDRISILEADSETSNLLVS